MRETREVIVPQHRVAPLKKTWSGIMSTVIQSMKLCVKFDIKKRKIVVGAQDENFDVARLQKAADFIQAVVYGFSVEDSEALVRLNSIYLETFDIKDIRQTLQGDHVGRAIGRLAGKSGKTRFTIETLRRRGSLLPTQGFIFWVLSRTF